MYLGRETIKSFLKQGENFIFLKSAKLSTKKKLIISCVEVAQIRSYFFPTCMLESMGQTSELYVRVNTANEGSNIMLASMKKIEVWAEESMPISLCSRIVITSHIEIISDNYFTSKVSASINNKKILKADFMHHISKEYLSKESEEGC